MITDLRRKIEKNATFVILLVILAVLLLVAEGSIEHETVTIEQVSPETGWLITGEGTP